MDVSVYTPLFIVSIRIVYRYFAYTDGEELSPFFYLDVKLGRLHTVKGIDVFVKLRCDIATVGL